MPNESYSLSATRNGEDGILDKIALIDAMAWKYAADRRLQTAVLRAVKAAGNGADEQVAAWERYLESLPYRRELDEILRDPLESLEVGGDCDDLALLALAGLRALAIPCEAEVISDSEGNGFHIRVLAGLPPLNPEVAVVIDPVYRSEPQWAMKGKNPISACRGFRNGIVNLSGPEDSPQRVKPILSGWQLAGAAAAGFWILRELGKRKFKNDWPRKS